MICRNDFSKEDLFRFAVNDETLLFDIFQKAPARGFYVCQDTACLEKAFAKNALKNRTKSTITEDFYPAIQTAITNNLKSSLSLMKKASLVTFGLENVIDLSKQNKLALVITATDMSKNSKDKLRVDDKICVNVFDKLQLQDISNVANCSVIGIKKTKMCKTILKNLKFFEYISTKNS